jgi:hypothetical protein
MPCRLKLSPLQRDIVVMLEEAGVETIAPSSQTLKPSDQGEFAAQVNALVTPEGDCAQTQVSSNDECNRDFSPNHLKAVVNAPKAIFVGVAGCVGFVVGILLAKVGVIPSLHRSLRVVGSGQ